MFENFSALNIEYLKAEYFDKNKLLEPPYKVYRCTSAVGRTYFTIEPDKSIEIYLSNTTFIKLVAPTNEALIKWKCDMGYEEAKQYTFERALYGSYAHSRWGELIMQGSIDISKIDGHIKSYMEEHHVYSEALWYQWKEDIKNDIACFAQWIVDYEVEVLAIEMPLVSKQMGIGTLIDIVCTMNEKCYTDKTPKDKRKRVFALGDFKSGRKQFYEEHIIQLESERQIWEENYPDMPKIEMLFNWSPKEFRGKTPTYNIANQTDEIDLHKFNMYLELGAVEMEKKRNKTIKVISGIIEFGKSPEQNISEFTLIDAIQAHDIDALLKMDADAVKNKV